MIVRYFRTGGLPPSDDEMAVTVDDGRYAVWRSNNVAIAGSFAGHLAAATEDKIQRLAAECAAAGDVRLDAVPDSAIESIELEGAKLVMGQRDEPPAPWSSLVAELRSVLERTDEPHAAVALTVAPDGGRATLEHRGSAELRLDLGGLKVSARRRGGDKDSTTAVSVVQPPNAAEVVAGPGWRLELPVSVTPELAADERIVAEADFIAYEHDRQVAVHLVASSRESP